MKAVIMTPKKMAGGCSDGNMQGFLLLQVWGVNNFIPVNNWPQLAEFINLLRACPECFRNPIQSGIP